MKLLSWICSWHGKARIRNMKEGEHSQHAERHLSLSGTVIEATACGKGTAAEFGLPFKFWNSRSSLFLSSTCSNSCFWSSSTKQTKKYRLFEEERYKSIMYQLPSIWFKIFLMAVKRTSSLTCQGRWACCPKERKKTYIPPSLLFLGQLPQNLHQGEKMRHCEIYFQFWQIFKFCEKK